MIMKLYLYRLLTFLAKPFIRPILCIRRKNGLETTDKNRKCERFGYASVKRPSGKVYWFNAASVGESNSIISVVNEILDYYKDVSVLITTTTLTAGNNIAKKFNGNKRVIHQFLPIDRRAYVDRFFKYWKPTVGFFVDSDFWPNLILSAKANNVPLILLNGRISDRSFARYEKNLDFCKPLMSAFIYGFGKSEEDRKRIEAMGIKNTVCVGNLKYGVPVLGYDKDELNKLRKMIGNRHLFVVSSTHPGEEERLLCGFLIIKKRYPDVLMIIAPRHPARGAEIKDFVVANGLKASLRSAGEPIKADTDVYVADTMGELGLFYTLSNVVFVGGSFANIGGHNPMEPARLHCVVLSGKIIHNFKETYDILIKHNCVAMVDDENDFASKVKSFFEHPDIMKQYMDKAFEVAEREADVLERTMDKLKPILDNV